MATGMEGKTHEKDGGRKAGEGKRDRVCPTPGWSGPRSVHTRKISREKQRRDERNRGRDTNRRKTSNEGRMTEKRAEGERGRERERVRGRKFSSGAFICSLNEMRMHYTWIAGDINFLPWTCSGPWRVAGWSPLRGRRGLAVSIDEARGLQREGMCTSIEKS